MSGARLLHRLGAVLATSLVFAGAPAQGQTADEQFRRQFAAGVEAQQRAEDSQQTLAQRAAVLAQAGQAYTQALRLRPDSIATLNNLGALNASLGNGAAAREYYRQAVAVAQKSADPKLEGYALNYAEYLEASKDPEALPIARIAFNVPGSSGESRELLARLYAKQAPQSLLPFCVTLLDQGFTQQVRQLAIVRANDDARATDIRSDWLILFAVTVARDALGAVGFDPATAVSALKAAADDPTSPGIKELQAAVRQPTGDGRAFGWWLRASEPRKSIGISGRAAMLQLLRALGERESRIGSSRPQLAAQYFRTAIDLGERGPDPEAFLALVNILADTGNNAALADLMRRYEAELFSEKGEAYSRQDWPLIFRLHLALGLTYARQDVWKSSSPFQNARFQLESAQKAAVQLNARARAARQPETAALPAAAVSRLSAYYDGSGLTEQSVKLRVDTAQMLLKAERVNDSKQVLREVQVSQVATMSPTLRAQFESLRSTIGPL